MSRLSNFIPNSCRVKFQGLKVCAVFVLVPCRRFSTMLTEQVHEDGMAGGGRKIRG